jgi:hypothetical protein
MAKPTPAELPASMAILGLLLREPNLTVAEVAQRLDERFPESRFDRTTAYNALPQMARGGQSRPRVRCTCRGSGRERTADRYELTSVGIESFRAWMYATPGPGTPTLREALYGRIELCKLEDLPELIRIAREEALIAKDLYSNATTQLKLHKEDISDQIHEGQAPEEDYLQELRDLLLYVTPEYWGKRFEHWEEIRSGLEKIARKAGIPFQVPQ